MITNKLFEMQEQLDTHIEKQHGLESADLFDKKILALLVELGELANERRSFKFWSTKAPSSKEVILEEYVDGVHFILSLGIIKGYIKGEYHIIDETENDITNQFLAVYNTIMVFSKEASLENYKELVSAYLYLGNLLGFSEEEIFNAYVSKNEVNYLRQKQGY